jgi:hypothetical protein
MMIKEAGIILDELAKSEKLPEEDLAKARKKIGKLNEMMEVIGVKEEGKAAVTKVNITEDKKTTEIEVKFNLYDTGWKIDEIKLPGAKWMSMTMVKSMLASTLGKSREKATIEDLKMLGGAIEFYMTDEYKAPEVTSITELKTILVPDYMKVVPETDGWGNLLFYKAKGDLYQIRSAGPDGKLEDWRVKGDDLIYQSGIFVTTQGQLDKELMEWEK